MTPTDLRARVVRHLLDEVQGVRPGARALIALDGFDGVGKSHLAAEILSAAQAEDRPMVSVTIDRFHRPRAERRAAGRGAEGFYRGSYRYDEFRRCVVEPLRAGRPLIPGVWDVGADRPIHPEPVATADDGIVVVDGIFLQRPELADVWDAAVWVDAPFEVTVPRGNARFPGDHDPNPDAPIHERYVGGQRLYLAEADPIRRSTWILDNRDLVAPSLTRNDR